MLSYRPQRRLQLLPPNEVMFLVVLVCLLFCLDYLQSSERICTKLLPEVCLGPRNNLDGPEYESRWGFAVSD